MKVSYEYQSVELYDVTFESWTNNPCEWRGQVNNGIPFLFTTTSLQWIFIVNNFPRSYFDKSRNNCFLGPLSCRFSAEAPYRDANKMNKEKSYNIVTSQFCLYYSISPEHLRVIDLTNK